MKISEMPEQVKVAASLVLADAIKHNGSKGSEDAANQIRSAFESLYSNGNGPDKASPQIIDRGEDWKSITYPSLTNEEAHRLLLTVSMMISTEIRTLRSEVYRLLLASQK